MNESRVSTATDYLKIVLSRWFVPLREHMVLKMMSQNSVPIHTFAVHQSDGNNRFIVIFRSETQLDQLAITCHPDKCKYSIGSSNPVYFNTLADIITNIITKKIRIKVESDRELKMRCTSKNPIPVGKWFIANKMGSRALEYFKNGDSSTFAMWLTEEGDYELGVNYDAVKTFKIYPVKNGYTLDNITIHKNIEDLVAYYTKNPINIPGSERCKALPRPFDCSAFYACMINRRMEVLLQKTPDKNGTRNVELFYLEFADLDTKSKAFSYLFTDATQPQNVMKNRYPNILAYNHSRVKLENKENDYINANFVMTEFQPYSAAYILCQAPKNETVQDMWFMIIQEKVKIIVVLTKLIEKGVVKCVKYWPDLGESMHLWDTYTVTTKDENQKADIIYSTLEIVNNNDKTSWELVIVHYLGWPDHFVPEEPWGTLELLGYFNHHREKNPNSTAVIHCSAGVGRSGAFVVLDILFQKIKQEGVSAVIDIKETVLAVRKQRAHSNNLYFVKYKSENLSIFINKCLNDNYGQELTNRLWKLVSQRFYLFIKYFDNSASNSALRKGFPKSLSSESNPIDL
ncbi:Tyrosine-protein phosphatase non-receptor type 6 [Thelohanellus kitauei]|uniref:Tyrosine-protein phosphatase non-receptor type 6 n=1 Tax=Thelohanellus kitauei TaxID=669202 RepID=A0A0C2M1N9_THEKT|nr:Tyrosine-protein phosphatase non-receptor type 6 [Thelohanellus kitauei]